MPKASFPDKFNEKPGYEGYLNFRVAALPEILSPEYYTLISGKWHLGLDEPYWPDKRGFEQSFTLLPGAGNHYKFDTKEQHFMPFLYQENGHRIDAEDYLPESFYSTQFFTTKFLEYLNDAESRNGRPFFGLLTYTAPHWPLQAPRETIEKYKGVYDKGPQALRAERLKRAAKMGIIPKDTLPHVIETQRSETWEELDTDARKHSSRIMETYAAMVEELDRNVGRIFSQLEKSGEFEDTLVMFLSDNGAEGMLLEALPFGGKFFEDKIAAKYDNSYDNIGNGDSFVYYGDMWAQAATAPRHMYKMWTTEGGINCPLILHYPDLLKGWSGDSVVDEFATVMDILPTALEIAGIRHPGTVFEGRSVHPVRGKSWVSFLEKNSDEIHSDNTYTGWELFGQRAIRKGDFKAVYIPQPLGSGKWQLFELSKDLGETRDLSEENPKKLAELIDYWAIYVAETGLVEINEYPAGTKYHRRIIEDNL